MPLQALLSYSGQHAVDPLLLLTADWPLPGTTALAPPTTEHFLSTSIPYILLIFVCTIDGPLMVTQSHRINRSCMITYDFLLVFQSN